MQQTPNGPSDRRKWSVAEVIDLEYFLAADREVEEPKLRQRDHLIFAQSGALASATAAQRVLHWLACRRKLEPPDMPTPGVLFHISFRLLAWLAVVLGILMGAGLAASNFRWFGDRPINVTWFFSEAVLVQFVILCGALWFVLRRRGRHAPPHFSLVQTVVTGALGKLVSWSEKALGRLPGAQRQIAPAGLGALRAKRTIYGSLALWPVLLVTQLFAIGFNVGLLAAIVSCVRFSPLAFGWGSALENPNQYALVRAVALPWSGLPNATPTFDQVEKSRVTSATQRSETLDAEALRSWWPFLCYGVVVYGLIPRTLLFFWALWKQRRALDAIPFDHADCQALLARLGGLEIASGDPPPPLEMRLGVPESRTGDCQNYLAIVASEIELADDAIAETVRRNLQREVSQILRAEIDCLPACNDALQALTVSAGEAVGLGMAVVIEAWQPPRQAYFSFIQELRKNIGPTCHIVILLLANGSQITTENQDAWERKIASLGDPYLRLANPRP